MLPPAHTATKAVPVGTAPVIAALCFDPLPLYLAQRADPALAHAALVCVEDGRVLHASAAAHRLGVTPGMRLSGARMRVEGLRVVQSREPEIEHAWDTLLRELHALTPWLEQGRRGRLFLRLEAREARALAERYGARVGVAAAREIAELAALSTRPGGERVVESSGASDFLARLPLRFLKGVGVSGKNLTRLHWLGLTTVGELARWNASQIRSYLGDEGDAVLPYLHGPYHTRLRAQRPPEVVQRSLAFEEPAREPRELLPALERLSTALERALAGRAARRLTLTAALAGQQRSATRLSKRPLAHARQIRQQALFALEDVALEDRAVAGAGIERLTLALAAPRRLGLQSGLWHAREDRQRALDAALERYPDAMVRFVWRDPYAEADDLAWTWERLSPAAGDGALGNGALGEGALGDATPDGDVPAAPRARSRRAAADAPGTGIAAHRHTVRAAAVPLFGGLADEAAAAPPAAPAAIPAAIPATFPTAPLLSPLPEDRHAHAHAPRPRHPEGPATGAGELAGRRT
jgi:nucleotidyltransferase/DNA polymerase involved in DNA repair